MTNFYMYGENAATFLIFQALAEAVDGIQDVFLPNLKKFGTGRTKSWPPATDIEVWLFPNFGKGRGFGEPDALVLAGKDLFWIEVETTIDCQRNMAALRNTLVQLWRFRLLQTAINDGPKTVNGSLRIVGQTLTNARVSRDASVRLSGHGVLQRIRRRLELAGKAKRDHYVLITVNKPKGKGRSKELYAKTLYRQAEELSEGYPRDVPRLPLDRCWYAYWNGDLEPNFAKQTGKPLKLGERYVRIKKQYRSRQTRRTK
ncbi:MAG: hypothetical protein RJP95_03435 [Pirellulales bacterium]